MISKCPNLNLLLISVYGLGSSEWARNEGVVLDTALVYKMWKIVLKYPYTVCLIN